MTDKRTPLGEHYERLVAMTEPDQQTWDLSDNDQKAIAQVLKDNHQLRAEVSSLVSRLQAVTEAAFAKSGYEDDWLCYCQTCEAARNTLEPTERKP
jgi:hypothetical protein